MKILAIVLGALIVLIQYPLWLGKGGWLKVWEADRQVATQVEQNDALQSRNDALAAEVSDLKQGMEAVEERARQDLGFVKRDEVFFQIVEPPKDPNAPKP
ncbi:MAG TPA: cell division protein FtsB [Burkholderiales bacterium]|nr:cell division protein FtsB [Burkholderiales bacterium]